MESLTLDELDHRVMHALELDGRASFSRIADVLGVSDQTVARRYRRLRTSAGLRLLGVRDSERLGLEQWTLRLRCAPDAAEAIAAALARRRDTVWIGLVSGGTEVVVHTRPRSRDEADELLLGKLPRTPSIIEIRAHQVLHRFFGGPDGWFGKQSVLTPAERDALRPARPRPPAAPVAVTSEDDALIAALERDGRATHPELQRATGRTESAVKRRLAALLSSGALFIDTEFDVETLGFHCGALLSITTEPRSLESAGRALATHPEIAFAAATSGPANLVAVAVTRDTRHLYRYLSGTLGALDGVRHVDTAPFVRRVKQLTYPKPVT